MEDNEQLYDNDNAENVEHDSDDSEQVDIPAELEGLSQDTVKELLAGLDEGSTEEDSTSSNLLNESESETGAGEATDQEEHAEQTSDNKEVGSTGLKQPKQKIPYERFKEKLDENKALKEQLQQLQARLANSGANNASNPTTQQQSAPPQQVQPGNNNAANQRNVSPQAQLKITPEVSKLINEAITEQAMQMTGLTQEEVDSIEYMDDDDHRKQAYLQAQKMAEASVYQTIHRAQAEKAARAQKIIENHNAVINDYNRFYEEQVKEPDFNDIVNYATGEYYGKVVPESERMAISDAYSRVERNVASPQDVLLVKHFFTDAKAHYRRKAGSPRKGGNPSTKLTQSKAHPRSEQLSGSAAAGGIPSVGELERMVNEVPWENIPAEYKKILMGD